jgi:hypothetical protein
MKKIFVVTSGCYSDYGINAVFSTRELAEEFIKDFPSRYGDENIIEEYPLDLKLPQPKGNRQGFYIMMLKDGNCEYVRKENSFHKEFFTGEISYGYDNSWMNIYVFANDEQHAIKIANEKRGELIAMDLWGK